MLLVATDGIRSVLARWGTHADDALVLVVRYLGAA